MEQIKKGNARLVLDLDDKGNGIMTSVTFMADKDCKMTEEDVFMSLAQGVQELAQRFNIDFDMDLPDLGDHETVQ